MDNHNRLKLKISRFLRSSSCGSCKSRTTSDVIARPETLPHTHHQYQLIDLFSPNPHPLPSIFRPKPELFSLPKVPHPSPLLTPRKTDGPKCPPASPMSPFIAFSEFQQPESKPRRKKSRKKRSRAKTTQLLKRGNSDNYYDDSEAEDDDDEKTTLFSSVSLSSDSSDSFRRNRVSYKVNRPVTGECEMGLAPLQGKVKDSFVVKKRSSDPYDDFRSSMVEMIIERQIFGARDLEDLLRTFLSLNSYHHHRVIVQVYTEIWDALFSTLS
ncbi:transcription repressor OFP8-like [Rhododendron vialii]|uniref:transcription repressor OFP8-like n=1 Tax=Rhododendron vialii TaxID=182163 RepID=UPI00265D8E25|nr:transcription repressor OFP8-like [Rhododendron vialii]